MTARGLVSLIMPVWSPRPDWLHEAVATALASGIEPLELIVVDDGCPEPVEELLRGVTDSRLRVLRVEHGGPYRARNAGLAAAEGETIRFIDADDVLVRGSTDRLLRHVRARDDVVAYGATLVCDADLRPIWKMTSRLQGDALYACLLGRFTARLGSILLPRRVVEAAGEWDPDFRVSGDWDFILRALEHAELRGDAQVASLYRRHGGSVTENLAAGRAGAKRAVERYFERHPEERARLSRRVEAMLAAQAARVYVTHGQIGPALAGLGRALSRDPRAVADEVAQATPALRARARRMLARR